MSKFIQVPNKNIIINPAHIVSVEIINPSEPNKKADSVNVIMSNGISYIIHIAHLKEYLPVSEKY